jgi:hypothetical protein
LGQGSPSGASTGKGQGPRSAEACADALPNAFAGSVNGGPTLPLGAPATGSISSATPTGNGTQSAPTSVGQIDVSQLFGRWTDGSTGETVDVSPTARFRPDGIKLSGHYEWDGSFAGQVLTLSRIPALEEMGEAPQWAKAEAHDKFKWELELHPRRDGDQFVLEGNWYPGCYKWSEEIDPNSSAPPKRVVSAIGRGTPITKKYLKPPPAISDVIVLNDQTALLPGGKPKWAYPSDERVLFVYGRGLPRSWSEPMEFKSEDPNLRYFAVALSAEKNLAPLRQEQIETGWREARKNLDADTILITRDLDALLVYARSKTGILPGLKEFTLNGASGSWRLRFGDDRASISFMRAITEDVADPTSNLVLPERVFLEVRTGAAFPIESIALKAQLNGSPVTWGGAKTIEARRVEPTVYRTNTIELVESGRSMPAAEQGVFFLPAQVRDVVDVRLEDPFLLGVTPASTVARVIRTPSELGETWKEALLRAAKADGIANIDDWGRLTASKATEFANYEVTPIILKVLDSATPLKFLRYVPSVYRYVEEVERGKLREKTRVTVGDHAALLLFRDQFVKSMTAAADNLDQIKGEVALRGFREAIKLSAWDDDSPWRYLRVSCPDGSSDCSFPMVVSDSYLERAFGTDRKAADQWVRKAVDEAIQKYRQATRDAIAKAKDIKDNDVRELMKLIGVSYLPLLPAVQARMMRLDEIGDPKRQLWIPDRNGRYELRNLHTVVDAVQAQEDYSKLDTQMGMLLAAAVTAPFILEEGAIGAAIAWGTDTAFLGVQLATDVPEFIEQRQEIHFALGASIILGTQRLQEAELKKTEWFQLVGQLGPAVLGPIASTVRMVGVVRSSLILSAVERGGLKAFEALNAADKGAFWRYATEAEMLQELGETKAMTQTHRRAIAATEKLLDEMGMKAPDLPKTKTLTAVGEAGPAPLPKTKTLKVTVNAADETVELTEAGEIAGEKNAGKPEPSEPGKAPPEKASPAGGGAPPEKTPTITYGSGDPAPRVAPPKANSTWATVYNGRVRNFKLGAYLGGGEYSQVFELLDSGIAGCEKGCAIKIVSPDPLDLFFGNVNVVENIRYSSGLVDDAGVFQLRNLDFQPNAPVPYFIQEAKQANQAHFTGIAEFKAAAARIPGLRKAVVELAAQLRNHGLIWEDMKVANMIFVKDTNGEWIAGILDHDRIIRFAERDLPGNMGAWIGCVEAHIMPEMLESLKRSGKAINIDDVRKLLKHFQDNPGPYFRDIDLFWEKEFEYKKWIEFDANQRTYNAGGLTPEDIETRFPTLRDRTRVDPFDPGIEFNKPRGSSLNVVPFGRERQLALVPAADLALAA